MKTNRLIWMLLLLLPGVVAVQLPAQQTEVDRKQFEEIKAKAEKGDAEAQLFLGTGYYTGNSGLAQDYAEAVKWYRKAADQDEARGQFFLALCYVVGTGVPQDLAEAMKWHRKAAEQGLDLAQIELGSGYAGGRGVAQDDIEAAKWFRRAAEQELAFAQAILGWLYFWGRGVSQNYGEAVGWARKAAEQGSTLGQGMLGQCYAEGLGVPRNDVEAYKWLSLAAAQQKDDEFRRVAAAQLRVVEDKMSRDEIVEAQRVAAAFVPRKQAQGENREQNFERLAESILRLRATATGFFIAEDGYFISNEHVVKDATQIRLVTAAGSVSAKIVKVDAANDLALLKAEGKFAALPVAASRGVKLGNTVATVGFPNIGLQGFAPKLAKGEIASLSGAGDDARYFQISVPVQPGNSGGALVDERGNVVGVVSAKLSARVALASSGTLPENVNYAVKSSYLLSFLESVPEVSTKLKEPETKERKFEDVVKSAEQAAVLVLVY